MTMFVTTENFNQTNKKNC